MVTENSLVCLAVMHHVLNATWREIAQLGAGPVMPWLPFPCDCHAPSLCSLSPRGHLDSSWAQSTDPVASMWATSLRFQPGRRTLPYELQAIGWVWQLSSLTERVATGTDKLFSNFGRVISCTVYASQFLMFSRFNFLMYQLNSFSFTCLVRITENHGKPCLPGTGT